MSRLDRANTFIATWTTDADTFHVWLDREGNPQSTIHRQADAEARVGSHTRRNLFSARWKHIADAIDALVSDGALSAASTHFFDEQAARAAALSRRKTERELRELHQLADKHDFRLVPKTSKEGKAHA
ncbi:MAG: hypothetical protein AAFR84_06500 [Pseudomonadota bacterium]